MSVCERVRSAGSRSVCPVSSCPVSPEDGQRDDRKERQEDEEKEEKEEEKDVLDRQKCRAALASLRHAKWFQVSSPHSTPSLSIIVGSSCRINRF